MKKYIFMYFLFWLVFSILVSMFSDGYQGDLLGAMKACAIFISLFAGTQFGYYWLKTGSSGSLIFSLIMYIPAAIICGWRIIADLVE